MRIIDQLVYKITGDTGEFNKAVDSSNTKVNKFGSAAKKIFAGVTVAAVAASIKKVGELAIASADLLDRVDKMSQKIGMSRQAFQEWDYILGQSGASVDGLEVGLKTLSNAVEQADKGSKEYKDTFDKLGISIYDTNGKIKDQETLFNEVFSSLANMENQTMRTALATNLLGRSATDLMPALNSGADAIEALRSQAHELGLVYEDELVDKGVRLGDNVASLKNSFQALRTKALEPVMGFMVSVTDKMLGQKNASNELGGKLDQLVTINKKYNDALADLKTGLTEMNELMIAQLQIQSAEALYELRDTYQQSVRDIAEWNEEIRQSNEDIDKYKKRLGGLQEQIVKDNDAFAKFFDTNEDISIQMSNLFTSTEYTEWLAKTSGNMYYMAQSAEQLVDKLFDSADDVQRIGLKVSSAVSQNEDFVHQLAQAYRDGLVDLNKFTLGDKELLQKTIEVANAIGKQEEGIADARKENEKIIASYKYLSTVEAGIWTFTEALKEEGLSAYLVGKYTETLNMLYAKQAELIAADAAARGVATASMEKQGEIYANIQKQLGDVILKEQALGDAYDDVEAKRSILTNGIQELIEAGIKPESTEIQSLIGQLSGLVVATDDAGEAEKKAAEELKESFEDFSKSEYTLFVKNLDKQVEAFVKAGVAQVDAEKWKQAQIEEYQKNASATIHDYWLTDEQRFKESLEKQVEAFRQAGIDEVKIEEWKSAQIADYNQKIKDDAIAAAKEARDAWVEYGFDVSSSLTSLWTNINRIQENTHAAELARLEQEVEDAEEGSEAKADAEERLKNKRNQFAREEAKRQKSLATFEATLDAARAIMQVWVDRTLPTIAKAIMTGVVAAGTAVQIAAIQSAPVPSFDVGSIRVPQDTPAIVHRDEMILPAPIAREAREEGITISKQGGKASTPAILMIYLDGRKIAESGVTYINSGQVGKIDARVVK